MVTESETLARIQRRLQGREPFDSQVQREAYTLGQEKFGTISDGRLRLYLSVVDYAVPSSLRISSAEVPVIFPGWTGLSSESLDHVISIVRGKRIIALDHGTAKEEGGNEYIFTRDKLEAFLALCFTIRTHQRTPKQQEGLPTVPDVIRALHRLQQDLGEHPLATHLSSKLVDNRAWRKQRMNNRKKGKK